MPKAIYAELVKIKTPTSVKKIENGGTNATSHIEAAINLGGISTDSLNKENGVCMLDEDGLIPYANISGNVTGKPTITGVTKLGVNDVIVLTITNYNSSIDYSLEAISGSVSRVGDTITYTAPSSVIPAGFILNNKTFNITVVSPMPITPVLLSHFNNAIINPISTILVDNFDMITGSDTHEATDWQIATDIDFTSMVIQSTNDTVNKLSWDIPSGSLLVNTNYYIRVRFKGTTTGYGDYSDISYVTTKPNSLPNIEFSKLVASDKLASDNFGYSVAMDNTGTRVIIGAYQADPSGLSNAGKAYVFKRSGNTWLEEQILTASNLTTFSNFGYSVAISGDGTRCVVGARSADPDTISNSGSIYVFSRSGTVWTEEQLLIASDKLANDNFGHYVAIDADGSRLIVGAPNADPDTLLNAGKAYVFTRSGTVWTEEVILKASDRSTSYLFGQSVSITDDGSRVIVGTGIGTLAAYTGKSYIFTRSGTVWTEEQILTASDANNGNRFGWDVAISGDGSRCVVGAITSDQDSVNNSGSAYVFTRSGTVWTEEAILKASDKAAGDNFGRSVTISGDGSKVLIGADTADPNELLSAGKVYTYLRTGTSWAQVSILIASDKATSDLFGKSIDIDSGGGRCIIGAYSADPGGIADAGAVYMFN